ncbi:MAG: hypothetical protein AAB925_00315 [Patescibacteria group bacterium]
MNKWVEKSIDLAGSDGYLDKLMDIYPVDLALERNIDVVAKDNVIDLFNKKDTKKLISALLDLERFPIDDPYIGFLRKDRSALNKNPKTVIRISERLYKMGIDELLLGANQVKSPSRQVGQMFRNWFCKIGYPILSKEEFLVNDGICVLDGADAALAKFAREELGYSRKKGLDAVFKIKNKFFIAETKLITMSGGGQNNSFREGIAFIKNKSKKLNATRITIFDGVVWIISEKAKQRKKKLSLYETIINLKNNKIALSALLLKDFIENS